LTSWVNLSGFINFFNSVHGGVLLISVFYAHNLINSSWFNGQWWLMADFSERHGNYPLMVLLGESNDLHISVLVVFETEQVFEAE